MAQFLDRRVGLCLCGCTIQSSSRLVIPTHSAFCHTRIIAECSGRSALHLSRDPEGFLLIDDERHVIVDVVDAHLDDFFEYHWPF